MSKPNRTVRLDEVSATVTYIGIAAPVAVETDLVWQIRKITIVGTVTSIKYASGEDRFNKSWSLRATYTYS